MDLVEDEVEPAVEGGRRDRGDGGDQGDGERRRQRGEHDAVGVPADGRDEQGDHHGRGSEEDDVLHEVDGALGDPGALGGGGAEEVPDPVGGQGVAEGHPLAGAGDAGGELEVAGDQQHHARPGDVGRRSGSQHRGVGAGSVALGVPERGAHRGGVADGGADGTAQADEVTGLGEDPPGLGHGVSGRVRGQHQAVHEGRLTLER